MAVLPCAHADCTLQAHEMCEMCPGHCFDAPHFQGIVDLLRSYPYPDVLRVLEDILKP